MKVYEQGPVGGFVGYVEGDGFVDFIGVDGEAQRWDAATDVVSRIATDPGTE